MSKHLNNLKIDLEKIYKNRLSSIILYGSAAVESYNPKTSDINLIVIIENLVSQDLKAAYPVIKKWLKTKNPTPLFMDKQEWFNSLDVYAIECSDIKERHKIIYGENLVTPITIDLKDIRLQCESETKHMLVRLRQAYLVNNRDKRLIKELLIRVSKSTTAIFRAVLRLLNEPVPEDPKEVVKIIAEKLKFDNNVFIDILLFRENKKKFNNRELEENIQKLIDSLEFILNYIDKLEV